MGKTRGRKRVRIGPVMVNLTSHGFGRWRVRSWGLTLGRWSWNAGTRRHRINLAGPWTWASEATRKGQQ